MKDIQLFDISRFRAEHMGWAMVFIILFHIHLPQSDPFFGLRRMGNIGVDIFLLLSGIGLWFSWTKNTMSSSDCFLRKWVGFYWRRLKRIYPAWIVVTSLYYIPKFLSKEMHTLREWIDLFGDILINWDFWLHDELTFWYVPAIMMLYVFAPPYMELVRRHPLYKWLVVMAVVWCVIVQYVSPIHHALGHIEIFWSRIPIFFLGINIADGIKKKETIEGNAIWMIVVFFVVCLATCVWLEQMRHGKFPLFLERMVYIPLTISTVLLLTKVIACSPKWLNKAMAWIGGISLEIYLIHYEFVLRPLSHYHLPYWLDFICVTAIALPLAWLLQKILGKITRQK